METNILKQFDLLDIAIRQFESVRSLRQGSDLYISTSLEWLRSTQHPDGYWGEKSMLATQLTLLALGMWDDKTTTWTLPDGNAGGVDRCFDWLERSQTHGAWDYNIWDTSAILQAAAKFDKLERPNIRKAKDWIELREADHWGLETPGYGAHYASQALIAMVECHSAPALIETAKLELLLAAGEVAAQPHVTPYIEGQVVWALIVGGVSPAHPTIERLSARLLDSLLNSEVTISNWLHLCAAFRGLNLAIGADSLDRSDLQQVIQRLFSPNRIRDDGSWYRDVALTAWALMALDAIRTVRRIDGYSYQILGTIERARQNVIALVRADTRNRRWLLIYGFILPIPLTAVIVLTTMFVRNNRDVVSSSDLQAFLIPIAAAIISFIIVRVRRLL